MAADIPTAEPLSARAGDTWRWTRALADYPASDGWALSYVLINAGAKVTISASSDGDDHAVTVAAAATANYAAGAYEWVARVSKSGEVYTVGTGRITVLPSLSASTADLRTHARKTLEAIEAVIEGRASQDVLEYQIAGRSLKRIPVADLLMLRDRYRAEVAREDAANRVALGLPDRRRVFVRFA
jgi:hypothetical protein